MGLAQATTRGVGRYVHTYMRIYTTYTHGGAPCFASVQNSDNEVSAHPLMTAFKHYNPDRPIIFKRRMSFLLERHVAPTCTARGRKRGMLGGSIWTRISSRNDNGDYI